MKKIFFLLLSLPFAYHSYAQTIGYIRNDTIKLTNAAKNTTLVIESASRGHNWYLKDIGNGRTQFVEANISDVAHLQDSLDNKLNKNNPVYTGNLKSISSTAINSYWSNLSPLFISQHGAINLTLQSADPAGGGAGLYLIDSTRAVNGRVLGINNVNSKLNFVSINDNGNIKDTLATISQLGDFYAKRNIYQNGNQVANDNAVVHKTGNETWTGDKKSHGFFTTEVLALGDGTFNLSTGNSWGVSQDNSHNAMRWVIPNANSGPAINFFKNGSNTLTFGYFNGSYDTNGGTFDFNGVLKAENKPATPHEVVRKGDLDTLIGGYVKKSGDVMTDSLDVTRQLRNIQSGYSLASTSPTLSLNEGMAYNGTNYWGTRTSIIYKYDANWNKIDSTNIATLGLTDVNHFGDPAILADTLFVPAETYNTINSYSHMQLVKIQASTLALISTTDLSGQGDETSGFTINDNKIISISFAAGTRLRRFQLNGTYIDSIHLAKTMQQTQGIAYKAGRYYLGTERGLYSCDTLGQNFRLEYQPKFYGEAEGLEVIGSQIGWLLNDAGSGTKYVRYLQSGATTKLLVSDANADLNAQGSGFFDNTLSIGTSFRKSRLNIYDGRWTKAALLYSATDIGYIGKDLNSTVLSNNAQYDGAAWVPADSTKTKSAIVLGTTNTEMRFAPAGSTVRWFTTRLDTVSFFPAVNAQLDLGKTSSRWKTAKIVTLDAQNGLISASSGGVASAYPMLNITDNYMGSGAASAGIRFNRANVSSTDYATGNFSGNYIVESGADLPNTNFGSGTLLFKLGSTGQPTFPFFTTAGIITTSSAGVLSSTTALPSGTTATTLGIGNAARQQLSVGANLDLYSGSENSATMPSIRATSANLYLNSFGTSGDVYISADHGSGKVHIGSAANNDRIILDGSTAGGGTITASGGIISGAAVRFKGYTVATLPTGTTGDNAYVTDAVSPTYLGALTGGGSITVPVFYNGIAWVSH